MSIKIIELFKQQLATIATHLLRISGQVPVKGPLTFRDEDDQTRVVDFIKIAIHTTDEFWHTYYDVVQDPNGVGKEKLMELHKANIVTGTFKELRDPELIVMVAEVIAEHLQELMGDDNDDEETDRTPA